MGRKWGGGDGGSALLSACCTRFVLCEVRWLNINIKISFHVEFGAR